MALRVSQVVATVDGANINVCVGALIYAIEVEPGPAGLTLLLCDSEASWPGLDECCCYSPRIFPIGGVPMPTYGKVKGEGTVRIFYDDTPGMACRTCGEPR